MFEDVRGCALTIPRFHASISFTTSSDALVSSFFVKYADSTPLQLFDDVLALLQRPDFRNHEVTMRTSEDIMDHIAAQRRLVAANREQKPYTFEDDEKAADSEATSSCRTRTWTIVPQLLAEYAGSRTVPLHRVDESKHAFSHSLTHCEMTALLKALALVHRAWTGPAQRALRRRVQLLHHKQLQDLLMSPSAGPGVRELGFRGLMPDMASVGAEEAARLLARVLARCPRITHLRLDGFRLLSPSARDDRFFERAPETRLSGVLGRVAALRHLQHLSLRRGHVRYADYFELRDLCSLLPALPALKSLSLENMQRLPLPGPEPGFPDPDPNPEPRMPNTQNFPHASTPPAALAALSLIDVDVVASGVLAWLVHANRNRSRITALELACPDLFLRDHHQGHTHTHNNNNNNNNTRSPADGDGDALRPLFLPALAHLAKLQLVECGDSDFAAVARLLTFFPELQALSLALGTADAGFPGADADTDAAFALPASVREFHFHYMRYAFGAEHDSRVRRLLEAHPRIRRICITYSNDACSFSETFKNSLEYCARNGVEFEATKTSDHWYPHFLDF